MAGALTDPVDGAIFIFRNVTKEVRVGAGAAHGPAVGQWGSASPVSYGCGDATSLFG